jgi:hypothetical protein
MQPTRILPDLQASLLCEDVRQEVTGNLIVIGVIAAVHVPQLPVTAHKLCVFNRWAAGLGNFTETVRLVAPDQTTVLRQTQAKFGLNDPATCATNVTLMAQVKFEIPGTYYLEVLVDDVLKLRFPIPLRIVTPPQGGPQPPKPPAEPQ